MGNRKLKKIDLDKASEIILDMKAIILAAGIGSRLETLTNDKPNCMLNSKFQFQTGIRAQKTISSL